MFYFCSRTSFKSHFSFKVCGGASNDSQNGSCSDNRCGCHDNQGNFVCGGEGCDGTKSSSLTALKDATNLTDSLKAAMKELQGVTKKVVKLSVTILPTVSTQAGVFDCFIPWAQLQDIASQTQDVKNRTMNALEKAQKKKEYFEKSNKDLKDLIKTIKDFLTGLWMDAFRSNFALTIITLTKFFLLGSVCLSVCLVCLVCWAEEGADPESIQKVAQQVLDIKLPINRTTVDKLINQINSSIANLTNVQDIMNQTSQLIRNAQDLMNKAKEAEWVVLPALHFQKIPEGIVTLSLSSFRNTLSSGTNLLIKGVFHLYAAKLNQSFPSVFPRQFIQC